MPAAITPSLMRQGSSATVLRDAVAGRDDAPSPFISPSLRRPSSSPSTRGMPMPQQASTTCETYDDECGSVLAVIIEKNSMGDITLTLFDIKQISPSAIWAGA
jgi:hypothetical protein